MSFYKGFARFKELMINMESISNKPKILQSLRRGESSVYDALNQPRCWLCDLTHQGEFVACQRVDFESIPKDSLPAIGTMLLATSDTEISR